MRKTRNSNNVCGHFGESKYNSVSELGDHSNVGLCVFCCWSLSVLLLVCALTGIFDAFGEKLN